MSFVHVEIQCQECGVIGKNKTCCCCKSNLLLKKKLIKDKDTSECVLCRKKTRIYYVSYEEMICACCLYDSDDVEAFEIESSHIRSRSDEKGTEIYANNNQVYHLQKGCADCYTVVSEKLDRRMCKVCERKLAKGLIMRKSSITHNDDDGDEI